MPASEKSIIGLLSEAFEEIKENDTAKYILLAACIKNVSEFSIALFQPLFFGNVYPDFGTEFNVSNAFTYLVPTTIGALAGGYLSDKLETKSYMSKSYIIIGSLLISSPFAYLAFMNMDDFWFST